MKPEDLKNSMNSIKPDSYMETRLFAEIKDAEKPKKKSGKLFKAAVCTALCCAVLVAGIGIGIPKKVISDSNENVVETENANNYFVMSVYAAENDKETATPIDDKAVTFSSLRYDIQRINDGVTMCVGGTEDSEDGPAIEINGENIKSVKVKCDTGSFMVWGFDMLNFLRENETYFDLIVPYSAEYEVGGTNKRLDIMFKHIKNGDYDEYIKGKEIRPYDDYISADVVYDNNDNAVAVGLVSKESYAKIHPDGIIKEYTFENVHNKTENIIGDDLFLWDPDTTEFSNNPDMSITELHDTISIEVTFNDGSVQTASYDFSFNDNGELVVQRIAE